MSHSVWILLAILKDIVLKTYLLYVSRNYKLLSTFFFSSEKCEVFWRLPAKCQVGRETEERHYCFMVPSIPSESDWLTWAKRGRRDEVLSEPLANGFCGGDATFITVILRGTPIASEISARLCLRSKTHRRKRDLSTNFFGRLLLTDSGQRSGSWKDFSNFQEGKWNS